jgi:O-methyltransferase
MLLQNKRFQSWMGGTFLEWLGIDLVARMERLSLSFHKDKAKLKTLSNARRERRSLVTYQEMFILHSLACGMKHLPGSFAEVGIYQGSTAKIICEAKGDKAFHLCDTFEGLPEPQAADHLVQKKGRFACGLDSIQKYLAKFDNLHYHVGYCPDSIRGVLDDEKFCLVHLDVDLYESTKYCLEYFWPRLLPGGVIISHDYSILSSVKQAFHEFMEDKQEKLIELPTTQCMMIKT